MKPKLIEFIPFYGILKYIRRYFNATKRNYQEAYMAQWFELYHIILSVLVLLFIFAYFQK